MYSNPLFLFYKTAPYLSLWFINMVMFNMSCNTQVLTY